ncbi:MAG TPA: PaaI family thioesterase [Alcaligenes sp.]|nr:PaaI family thioesterase [Alcaligenes sp.]HRL27048.1 PaaI family thioesterase [Alcaligenes sp.]
MTDLQVDLPLRQHDFFGTHIPLMQHLGLQTVSSSPQGVQTFLPWQACNANARDDVHGGTLMAVLDFTLSAAARACRSGSGMATIDMNTQFLLPARSDVWFRAQCLFLEGDTAYCEGGGYDDKDRLLVKAAATFRIVRGS